MLRHQVSTEHQHRYARLKQALRASPTSEALALRSRLTRCNGPDWGFRYTCRSPACPACRDRYIGKQRREAQKRFSDAPNDQMAMITINLGAVREVQEIGAVMAKARRDMRNLIDRQRQASPAWAPVEVLAWLETDAFAIEDYPRLGPDKREQVGEFIQIFHGMSGVIWLPSLHGVVRLGPMLDIGTARDAFRRQWPGHRRVDLRPFFADCAMAENLGRVINYSLKHECTTEFYDPETGEITAQEWENQWLGQYYGWLHGWSRGFQSTRITVKPMKFADDKKPDHEVLCTREELLDAEPLPFTCDISVFPTDYYYWQP